MTRDNFSHHLDDKSLNPCPKSYTCHGSYNRGGSHLHSARHESMHEEESGEPEHRRLRCVDPPEQWRIFITSLGAVRMQTRHWRKTTQVKTLTFGRKPSAHESRSRRTQAASETGMTFSPREQALCWRSWPFGPARCSICYQKQCSNNRYMHRYAVSSFQGIHSTDTVTSSRSPDMTIRPLRALRRSASEPRTMLIKA